MANERILVIDDEDDLLELVSYNLKKEHFSVETATTGEDGLKLCRSTLPDLVVLDLMLPGMDGVEVCRALKNESRTKHISVLMLTAKSQEADVVRGLEIGADDYVAKPFSTKVLVARINALLRRRHSEVRDEQATIIIPPPGSDSVATAGTPDLVIHPGRFEVLVKGESVKLTLTEFRVLHFLSRRPGWVFTRYQIVNAVKGEDYPVTERSVDVQIVGLRRKLGECGHYIETVRGVGYRFKE